MPDSIPYWARQSEPGGLPPWRDTMMLGHQLPQQLPASGPYQLPGYGQPLVQPHLMLPPHVMLAQHAQQRQDASWPQFQYYHPNGQASVAPQGRGGPVPQSVMYTSAPTMRAPSGLPMQHNHSATQAAQGGWPLTYPSQYPIGTPGAQHGATGMGIRHAQPQLQSVQMHGSGMGPNGEQYLIGGQGQTPLQHMQMRSPGMGQVGEQYSGHPQAQHNKTGRRAQQGLEEAVSRTVYVSYIDTQVTEENLASFFSHCGQVLDCRLCGDPNSSMRFGFVEFAAVDQMLKALNRNGGMMGGCPLRVLPSKTAIMPVSRDLMPRSMDELQRCARTVYVANIERRVERQDMRSFFEQLCGPVSRLRLLGDASHATRIAFVEFETAEGAMAALNCTGALLGGLPVRVAPSKTPVRSDASQTRQSKRTHVLPHGEGSGSEDQVTDLPSRPSAAPSYTNPGHVAFNGVTGMVGHGVPTQVSMAGGAGEMSIGAANDLANAMYGLAVGDMSRALAAGQQELGSVLQQLGLAEPSTSFVGGMAGMGSGNANILASHLAAHLDATAGRGDEVGGAAHPGHVQSSEVSGFDNRVGVVGIDAAASSYGAYVGVPDSKHAGGLDSAAGSFVAHGTGTGSAPPQMSGSDPMPEVSAMRAEIK